MNHQDSISEVQARMDELEMRVTFQEDTIQILNIQIAHLQRDVEKQQQMLQLLYLQWCEMQETAAGEGVATSVQEKPPHY